MEDQAFRIHFGRALREAREAADLSQRELAERAGIADKYLSRVELGASSVSLYVANSLARALGVELDALINGGKSSASVAAVTQVIRGWSPEATARALRVLRALEDSTAPETSSQN